MSLGGNLLVTMTTFRGVVFGGVDERQRSNHKARGYANCLQTPKLSRKKQKMSVEKRRRREGAPSTAFFPNGYDSAAVCWEKGDL